MTWDPKEQARRWLEADWMDNVEDPTYEARSIASLTALLEAAHEAGVGEEREACEKVAFGRSAVDEIDGYVEGWNDACGHIGRAIRARGGKP